MALSFRVVLTGPVLLRARVHQMRKPKFWNGPMKAMPTWIAVLAVVFLAVEFLLAK